MIKTLLLTLTFFASLELHAQYQSKKNFTYKNVQYDVFIIKADSSLKNKFSIVQNAGRASEADFFAAQSTKGSFFAITAGIVDSSCKPLGLYITGGKEINSINLGSGEGSFYLKPNGVLAFDGVKFTIIESTAFVNSQQFIAIQPGPMLVNNGQPNANFTRGSKNRHIRCGVGIFQTKGNDYLVFAQSKIPVNFFDFANLFIQKYSCKMALNLTSASNCSLHLPGSRDAGRNGEIICNYIYIRLE